QHRCGEIAHLPRASRARRAAEPFEWRNPMTVTRDVILDLLPLYFAGEVSADTKSLVENFLKSDPDFARMSSRFDVLLQKRGTPSGDEATERRAFQRTRMLVRYRNRTIGLAAALSLMPFAFQFGGG